jgi:hypothetical protein
MKPDKIDLDCWAFWLAAVARTSAHCEGNLPRPAGALHGTRVRLSLVEESLAPTGDVYRLSGSGYDTLIMSRATLHALAESES